MKVRFWGTRGSIAKAGETTVRYGGNTSCVEVRSAAGTIVVLDCGTGAHGLGQSLSADGPKPCTGHILISHTHWDHIQGIPFFSPLFVPGNEWHIYGPRGLGRSIRDVLAGQMEYTYFPVTLDQFAATIHYHDVVEGTFQVGNVRIVAQYMNHPALTMGYRLEADGVAVVYSTDHEPFTPEVALRTAHSVRAEDEAHKTFVSGADLLIHDAQYTAAEYRGKIGWGHSTVEYATDMAMEAGVKLLVLYHHDPARTDDAVDDLVDAARQRVADASGTLEVSGAMEGHVIELEGSPSALSKRKDLAPSGMLDPSDALSKQKLLIGVKGKVDRKAIASAAAADNIEIVHVDNQEDLLEVAEREAPSLIFLGDDRPNADPLEICRKIRALPLLGTERTPLIVVTDEALVRGAEGQLAGVTDWLTRPFSMQYARTRIRAWLLRTACRWQKATLPLDEESRIEALHQLGILDTDAEERFDRHTRIAASALGAPIALISLVDHDRQWFKSRIGLNARETPRDMAFCAHAIHHDEAFVVRDALQDDRFADNPLVTHDPRVRFYAGVPLRVAGGKRVGTLCVIDHRPRDLNAAQIDVLKEIGELVELELSKLGRSES